MKQVPRWSINRKTFVKISNGARHKAWKADGYYDDVAVEEQLVGYGRGEDVWRGQDVLVESGKCPIFYDVLLRTTIY